ncbi:hypothetical protein [Flavobacterium sp.]|jgi:hypothetical protein|uniref:hypothetical protein n=2 Tax=Flavobacterium sp. TaxID=239 RepID=UPI0037BEE55E
MADINELANSLTKNPQKTKTENSSLIMLLKKQVTKMTEKDLNILKEYSENFDKGNEEGINYLASDSETYTESQYDELEKELENKIADTILEFKNKYLVLPTFKIENSDIVKVSLNINRYTTNPTTLYNAIRKHQNDHQKNNL